MAKAILFFFFSGLLLLSVLSAALIGSVAGSEMDAWGVLWDSKPRSRCQGSIGECLEDEEMQMDSESNRRVLASRTYISYAALRANSVPCTKSGSSYYNCKSTTQANPYKRSCTQITRCARSTSWDSNPFNVSLYFLFIFVYLISTYILHSFVISDCINRPCIKNNWLLREPWGLSFSCHCSDKPSGASDAWNVFILNLITQNIVENLCRNPTVQILSVL